MKVLNKFDKDFVDFLIIKNDNNDISQELNNLSLDDKTSKILTIKENNFVKTNPVKREDYMMKNHLGKSFTYTDLLNEINYKNFLSDKTNCKDKVIINMISKIDTQIFNNISLYKGDKIDKLINKFSLDKENLKYYKLNDKYLIVI